MSSIAFSQIVIDEAAAGDPAQAKKRLEILDSLFVLEVSNPHFSHSLQRR